MNSKAERPGEQIAIGFNSSEEYCRETQPCSINIVHDDDLESLKQE